MTQVTSDAGSSRCFGRQQARELTAAEIDSISGGASYTGISNFRWENEEGDATFNYSDYEP